MYHKERSRPEQPVHKNDAEQREVLLSSVELRLLCRWLCLPARQPAWLGKLCAAATCSLSFMWKRIVDGSHRHF